MLENKTLIAGGVITALVASLCCITPILAVLAGISSAASTFVWIEPFRPYLIGLTILILGFAWYQKLKPRTKEEIDCECKTGKQSSIWHSKKLLVAVTVLAVLLITFPHYSGIFFIF